MATLPPTKASDGARPSRVWREKMQTQGGVKFTLEARARDGEEDYVEVYNFEIYDPSRDHDVVPPSMRTRQNIREIGGTPVEGSVKRVRRSELGKSGRYYAADNGAESAGQGGQT